MDPPGPNITELIFGHFEKDTTVNKWIDPYDSLWLKIITLFVYIIELMASFILFAFVAYETSGCAGPYRTFINQLLSYLYGCVCIPKKIFNKYLIKKNYFCKDILCRLVYVVFFGVDYEI